MDVKIGSLLAGFHSGALNRLANASLPMRTALRLKSVLTASQDALKEYDDDRIALCREYGTLNKETGDYDIEPTKRAEFQVKADALLQNEVSLPCEPFSPGQLLSSQSISANDLMILDWLIVSEPMQESVKLKAVGK